MSKLVSIGTALPKYRHEQSQILEFMQKVYALNEPDKRKLRYLYNHSSINSRYSVIPDYSRPLSEWSFYPPSENLEPFPSLEQRMTCFNRYAAALSVDAIRNCIDNRIKTNEITHLITVSCTGMSAPGLDLHLADLLDLPKNIYRSSVNFMGCYAAIHALKMADMICNAERNANVIIVCTELCTLHFQRSSSMDNIASALLFGDGSAAALIVHSSRKNKGLQIESFYSEIIPKGKKDMAWEISSSGFLMTLSGYIPDLIEEDFQGLVQRALTKKGLDLSQISYWCIHPGGKKILESISKSLQLETNALQCSYDVMRDYGNMSSATLLFVLKKMIGSFSSEHRGKHIFGAAFGPGLTMETFIASV